MDILINVSKQRLKLATNLKKYVSGSQEFVRFVFGLNSYWRDLLTFAQFAQNGNTYNRYLDDENAVYLPAEIEAGECTLTLFGSGNSVIATTNYLTLTIDENILVSDATSTEISESLYEQLVDMVRSVSNGTAVVDAKNKMIDKNKIYVYIGSETGMTNGDWYYWNGTVWASGGVWNAVAVETDKTLSVENKAADGKAAGSLVEVGSTQPTSTANKIWIDPTDEEVEIPEMSDLNAVDAKVDNLKSELQEESYNKLDTDHLTANKYEPTGTGAPANYNGWSLSDFIPITKNDVYYMVIENASGDNFIDAGGSNLYVGYYNSEKVKIAGLAGSPIKYANDDLSFIRVSAPTTYFSKHAMVIDSSIHATLTSILDYQPFGKVPYPVVTEIKTLKTKVDEIKQKASEGTKTIDQDVTAIVDKIPDYYIDYLPVPTTSFDDDSYLESKIKQIPDGYSFIHISDVHCDHGTTYNAWHSIDLMNYVRKRACIDKVLFGGDILNVMGNTYDDDGHVIIPGKYGAKKELAKFLYGCRRAFGPNFLPTVGDHDANLSGTIGTENIQEGYEGQYVPYTIVEPLFFGDVKNRHCAIEYYQAKLDSIHDRAENPISDKDYDELKAFFKTVFYVDDAKNKIRWIVMNCGKSAARYDALYNVFGIISTEIFRVQYDWLNNTLLNTPSGYNVILHSHKASFNSGSMRGAIKMLRSFKERSSCYPDYTSAGNTELETWWKYNTNYNFANAPDSGLVFSVNGHTHEDIITVYGTGKNFSQYDGSVLSNTDIANIEINCDAFNKNVGHSASMTKGTITEHSFDVITIVSDGIVLTRFGAGSDRRIYINLG